MSVVDGMINKRDIELTIFINYVNKTRAMFCLYLLMILLEFFFQQIFFYLIVRYEHKQTISNFLSALNMKTKTWSEVCLHDNNCCISHFVY